MVVPLVAVLVVVAWDLVAATVVALVTMALVITDRANTLLETLAKATAAVVETPVKVTAAVVEIPVKATAAVVETPARNTEAVVARQHISLAWPTSWTPGLILRLSRMLSTRVNPT